VKAMSDKPGLKLAAFDYWNLGLNIIPILLIEKEKRPLVEWQKWNVERQTEQEFNALPWEKANAYAVVCGIRLKNGLFLGVIDQDVKNLPPEIIEKGKEAIKGLPITQMEKTPSGGLHYVYYSHEKPKTISTFHNDYGLELLGEKKLCLMYPSEGYSRLNDNTPTEVKDLTEIFYNVLGVKAESETEAWFNREDLAEKPYKGKTPYCIHELEKGTTEGLRNEYGIRLASFYGNFKQYKNESCLKLLRVWNKLNEPNLNEQEIDVLLRSALHGNYVYGCNDPILKSVCNHERCLLAAKPKKTLTENEKVKAETLLADPQLLSHILAYGKKRLLGEDDILIQNFVFMVSGQTCYPISEVLTGHSGSGKNESIRAVKPLIPEGWLFEFTTSTPEAIKYIPEDFAGTLIIYELAGIRSETGTLGLRSIGEGEGIKTIYPMRDEATGEMKLGEKQTNAKNFISTESGLDIAADLYRRVFKNSMNDKTLLTKRVIAKKLRDSSLPESLRKKLFPEQNKEAYQEGDFQNALSLIDLKAEVVIFPPDSLLDLIKLATKKEQEVALRSQIDRILNFIKILALIHQKQRICFKDDTNNYVIANPYDVEMALRILETSITETVSRIEKRQKEALDELEKHKTEGLDKNGLAEKLHISTKTAYRILKTLTDNGYLKQIEISKPFKYKIPEVDDKKQPSTFALLNNIREYKAFYENELKMFLDRLRTTGQIALSLSPEEKKELGFEDVSVPKTNTDTLPKPKLLDSQKERGISVCPDVQMPSDKEASSIEGIEPKPRIFFGKDKQKEVKREKQAEEWIVKREGDKVTTKTGEAMFQCLFCEKHGKPMFFSTEHDLKFHTQVYHGCNPDYVR
jgi:hypothetical protein